MYRKGLAYWLVQIKYIINVSYLQVQNILLFKIAYIPTWGSLYIPALLNPSGQMTCLCPWIMARMITSKKTLQDPTPNPLFLFCLSHDANCSKSLKSWSETNMTQSSQSTTVVAWSVRNKVGWHKSLRFWIICY